MDEIKQILEYNGNTEEFQKYKEIMNSPIENMQTINYYNIKQYEGNIVNGLYEGRGILYDNSGKMIYQGFFKSGKYEGFGRNYENNQLIYEGFFCNGKYEGKGTLYKNGDKYLNEIFLIINIMDLVFFMLIEKKLQKDYIKMDIIQVKDI